MGKRYLEFHYLPDEIGTYCVAKKKEYIGVGAALYHGGGLEEHPTKLMGETIAHLKAERDILKQQRKDKKAQLKHIIDFCTYMFPKKYDKALEDWLYVRRDEKIAELRDTIEHIENEIKEIDEVIIEYIKDKEDFLIRLKKKREKKDDNNTTK